MSNAERNVPRSSEAPCGHLEAIDADACMLPRGHAGAHDGGRRRESPPLNINQEWALGIAEQIESALTANDPARLRTYAGAGAGAIRHLLGHPREVGDEDPPAAPRSEPAPFDGLQMEHADGTIRVYIGMTKERWALFEKWEDEQRCPEPPSPECAHGVHGGAPGTCRGCEIEATPNSSADPGTAVRKLRWILNRWENVRRILRGFPEHWWTQERSDAVAEMTGALMGLQLSDARTILAMDDEIDPRATQDGCAELEALRAEVKHLREVAQSRWETMREMVRAETIEECAVRFESRATDLDKCASWKEARDISKELRRMASELRNDLRIASAQEKKT